MKCPISIALCCAAALCTGAVSSVCQAGDDSCCSIGDVAFPLDDATDLPLNPILVGQSYPDSECAGSSTFESLLDEDGFVVATEVAFTYDDGSCSFDVYRPVSNLEPNRTYTMLYGGLSENTFTTGTDVDSEPLVIEVGEEPFDGKDYLRSYSSNEELAVMTYWTNAAMGWIGHMERPSQTCTINGYRDTTFYDRAGNSTEVEAWLDRDNDSGCAVAGAGAGGGGRLLGLLVRLW
jgi:hypothetical protein